MINILEIIDGGFIGGGQTHILSIIKCLDKEKFHPVVAASEKGEFINLVQKNHISFENIQLAKFYRTKYLKNIEKIINKYKIDVIHSHGGIAGMYARFYKKKNPEIKIVHTIHGIHYLNSHNFIRKFLSLSIEQLLVKYTDRFICVSDSDFKIAAANKIINAELTTVIKNGIETEKFHRKQKNKAIMRKLNIEDEDFIIGNISRFDFQKNQSFIISNAKYILTKYPNVKILLVGDGQHLEHCRQMAGRTGFSGRIIFTGEVSDTENYYSLFDIFIFPSLWEGLSIALIEAMASSRCILSSNIPANSELIFDSGNGLLFDINDNKTFLDKLEMLIKNKGLRNKLSEEAENDSLNYSERIMTERIEKIYSELC
ncbi:MAG: glycosyltransferase [Ignavibacteria bacterium]